ncbi:uncharacterized protein AMSG_03191 [Thecamonas trahens ATCC 50062]|uniref:Uncharacterized protein n=1 Tax=Thecamonas trahens ATCC 50062 TaxID=461836 RepID=A0A0L0D623_THETB|nr:hypothetical protein AMSG_03191 [Thecamonas trahens ATCC 50062]KNC46763.1 hypothetical protein AMSG_03191 [Thecamonas trahens ATCC 50062]|eukprot:XP_013760041.1 hypothetical protein AMSG_03191 [Thecamonas trahens ATCC 50062]
MTRAVDAGALVLAGALSAALGSLIGSPFILARGPASLAAAARAAPVRLGLSWAARVLLPAVLVFPPLASGLIFGIDALVPTLRYESNDGFSPRFRQLAYVVPGMVVARTGAATNPMVGVETFFDPRQPDGGQASLVAPPSDAPDAYGKASLVSSGLVLAVGAPAMIPMALLAARSLVRSLV